MKPQRNRWLYQLSKPLRGWFACQPNVPSADIEEVAQEVFARLHQDGDDAVINDPQDYLFRLADSVAAEQQQRTQHLRPRIESSLEAMRVEATAQAVTQMRLQEAVGQLPPRYREALLMHFREGLTCAQIAKRQGLSPQIVLNGLAQTYARLRLQLDCGDVENSPGASEKF